MLTKRPWDTIEKVDQAFAEHNRGEERERRPRLTIRSFREKCQGLVGVTPVELGAIDRWASSRMRG